LKDDCKTPTDRRTLQSAFEKFGQIALLELRRYHKSGYINYSKSFNRALFMRKVGENPITDAQQRSVECSVPSGTFAAFPFLIIVIFLLIKTCDVVDEEEKDLFARSRAMVEASELEKLITTEDLKYPARYTPELKKQHQKGKQPTAAEEKAEETAAPVVTEETPAVPETTNKRKADEALEPSADEPAQKKA